ncbi:hypothetical protein TIFTF001_044338 [Ficus carica]|uniref:Uncharacterized protein n=1 Tax=Ficus carica TaxID=3494 RepID=A0AA88CS42_FICCA|nr:hypothetical protein TIFTF001_044338 [Ficus carica]
MLSAYSGDVCYASRKGNAIANCLATLASQFDSCGNGWSWGRLAIGSGVAALSQWAGLDISGGRWRMELGGVESAMAGGTGWSQGSVEARALAGWTGRRFGRSRWRLGSAMGIGEMARHWFGRGMGRCVGTGWALMLGNGAVALAEMVDWRSWALAARDGHGRAADTGDWASTRRLGWSAAMGV